MRETILLDAKAAAEVAKVVGGTGGDDGYIDLRTFMTNVDGKKLNGEKFVAFLKKYNIFNSFNSEYSMGLRILAIDDSETPYAALKDFLSAETNSDGTFKVLLGFSRINETNGVSTPLSEADVIADINDELGVINVFDDGNTPNYTVPVKFKVCMTKGYGEDDVVLDSEEVFDLFDAVSAPTEFDGTLQH